VAQISAEESAKKLKPADGLEATLWASEPMLVNPTTIDIDSRGRVWVTEGLNYRLTRGGNKRFSRIEGADKIKILEDTDNDGKADKVTIFADNIFPVPMGIAVEEFWSKDGRYTGCKVYVGNSPDLLVLEDTDGDDKADKRYPLLTGFGGIDSDHGVHGMVLGPDGKLYFTHGDGCCSVQQDHSERQQNFDVVDKSGRHVRTDQLGTVLRCNRDGTQFEILATRLRNDYECALDSFGNVFASDNDDDGNRGSRVVWIMDGGVYGYRTPGSPRHWGEEVPGNIPKLAGTGNGSPCGVMVYEGELLPEPYHGALLEAEAGPRVINAFPLKRTGAGFRTEQMIMLSSDDNWFRPVDVCAAPDGSVFVADWYDGGVGGHQFQDQTTGRIYRVGTKGTKAKKTAYDFASSDGLAAAFSSPNLAARDAARRNLLGRSGDDAIATGAMRNIAMRRSGLAAARVFWMAPWLPEAGVMEAAKGTLRDRSPSLLQMPVEVQETVVRMIGRDNSRLGLVDASSPKPVNAESAIDALRGVVDHPDPGVRRELLLSFRDAPTDQVGDDLKQLAKSWDGQDRYYLEALGLALRNREPEFIKSLFDGTLYGDLNLPEAGNATGIALPPYFPVDRNEAYLKPGDPSPPATALSKTIGLAWELQRIEALEAIATLMPSLETSELRQAAADVIRQVKDPNGARTLVEVALATHDPARRVQLLKTLAEKLESDWNSAAKDQAIVKATEQALAETSTRLAGIQLFATGGDSALGEQVVALAEAQTESPEIQAAAVDALARVRHPKAKQLVDRLLASAKAKGASTAATEAAVRAVLRVGDQPGDQLRDLMLADDLPLGMRRTALRTLVTRRDGAQTVLALAKQNKLPDALRTAAGVALRVHPDRDIRDEVNETIPITSASGKPLPALYELVRRDGDAEKGRAVFFQGGANACGSCHRVQGGGKWIGPDLSTIGTKYGKRDLLEHILNPSAAISDSFRSIVVALNDGRVVTGLPLEDSPNSLVLKTAEGKRERITPNEIESRRSSELSLMPDGLAQSLTEEQLVDLLAFLATLTRPSSIVGEAMVAGPMRDSLRIASDEADLDSSIPLKLSNGQSSLWRRVVADAEGRIPIDGESGSVSTVYISVPILSPGGQRSRVVVESSANVSVWLGKQQLELARRDSSEPWSADVVIPAGSTRLLVRLSGDKLNSPVVTVVAPSGVEFRSAVAAGAKR
jgi:putative membrane-bound dehydrogenase-like protein